MDRNWKFPNLARELMWLGVGIVATAVLIGAAIGVAVDVAVHRHRQGAKCNG